jgi:hypothetical protein
VTDPPHTDHSPSTPERDGEGADPHFPTLAQVSDGLQQLVADGDGVVEIHVIRDEDKVGLLAGTLAGDHPATVLASALTQFHRQVRRSPGYQPALCACCPRSIRRSRFTPAFLVPRGVAPDGAVALGICERCARTRDQVFARANEVMKRFWPNSRTLDISCEGGRA